MFSRITTKDYGHNYGNSCRIPLLQHVAEILLKMYHVAVLHSISLCFRPYSISASRSNRILTLLSHQDYIL